MGTDSGRALTNEFQLQPLPTKGWGKMARKKSMYAERDKEMCRRYADGETVHEIMLFAGLKLQRTCQILGISYKASFENNGHKPAPKPSEPEIGPYWVTCSSCCDSRLYRYRPENCANCSGRKLTVEPWVAGDVFYSRHQLRLRADRVRELYEFLESLP